MLTTSQDCWQVLSATYHFIWLLASFQGLLTSSKEYWPVARTSDHFSGLLTNSQNSWLIFRTADHSQDYWLVSKTSDLFPKLLTSCQYYWPVGLLTIFHYCWSVPRTANSFRDCRSFPKFQGLLTTQLKIMCCTIHDYTDVTTVLSMVILRVIPPYSVESPVAPHR